MPLPARLNGEIDVVVIERETTDLGGIPVRFVVPTPAVAQRRIIEDIVVADEVAVDAPDAGGAQRVGPGAEDGGPVAVIKTPADDRVAGSAHDDVALQDAVYDRPVDEDLSPVPKRRAELVEHRRRRVELGVRSRHEAAVGIALVEHLVAVEIDDHRAPPAVRQRGVVEGLVDGAFEVGAFGTVVSGGLGRYRQRTQHHAQQ